MSNNWKDDFPLRVRRIHAACEARIIKGSDTYSKRDISEDKKHLMVRKSISELIEELYDVINYATFEVMKLEELQRDIDHWELKLRRVENDSTLDG